MSIDLIKSELQTYVNFNFDCRHFYDFALADQKLLDAAASDKKYTWKEAKKSEALAGPSK